jgi:hypothetical protein
MKGRGEREGVREEQVSGHPVLWTSRPLDIPT